MVDVLNEDGSPTREVVSKVEVHEKGLWHRAAHIWFVNSKNEILLQQRAEHIESHPGEYDISAAGHLQAGDSRIEGALREIEEELGIKLKEDDLIKLGELRQESTQYDGKYINKEHNDVYVVKKDIPISDFTIDESEVDHIEYVPIDKFKKWISERKEDLVMHPGEFELLFDHLSLNQNLQKN